MPRATGGCGWSGTKPGLVLQAADRPLAEEISRNKHVAPLLAARLSPTAFRVEPVARGRIKQALVKIGFPAEDLAGYREGEPLPIALRALTASRSPLRLAALSSGCGQESFMRAAARGAAPA